MSMEVKIKSFQKTLKSFRKYFEKIQSIDINIKDRLYALERENY